MIRFNRFCFAALPGTGVNWLLKAMQLCGSGIVLSDRAHEPFESVGPASLKLSLVRHPLDWLTWYFLLGRHKHYPGLAEFEELDTGFYPIFLSQYLDRMPGKLTQLMLGYDGDSYMRYEDFPKSFLEFSESIDIEKEHLTHTHFQKFPRTRAIPCYWNNRVMQAEKELVDEFDYF